MPTPLPLPTPTPTPGGSTIALPGLCPGELKMDNLIFFFFFSVRLNFIFLMNTTVGIFSGPVVQVAIVCCETTASEQGLMYTLASVTT